MNYLLISNFAVVTITTATRNPFYVSCLKELKKKTKMRRKKCNDEVVIITKTAEKDVFVHTKKKILWCGVDVFCRQWIPNRSIRCSHSIMKEEAWTLTNMFLFSTTLNQVQPQSWLFKLYGEKRVLCVYIALSQWVMLLLSLGYRRS